MLEFRNYRPGDEEGIVDLLSLVFRERGLDWWRYYWDNPAGRGLIAGSGPRPDCGAQGPGALPDLERQ